MRLGPAPLKVGCDVGSKVVHPAAHCLVGEQYSAFGQQILDVADEGEPGIESDGLLDDYGWKAISGVADLGHDKGFMAANHRRQAQQRDNARRRLSCAFSHNLSAALPIPFGHDLSIEAVHAKQSLPIRHRSRARRCNGLCQRRHNRHRACGHTGGFGRGRLDGTCANRYQRELKGLLSSPFPDPRGMP